MSGDRSRAKAVMVAADGQRLKAMRLGLGLSQFRLAVKVGVRPSTVPRAEKGIPVRPLTLFTILAGLDVDPKSFWGHVVRTDPPTPPRPAGPDLVVPNVKALLSDRRDAGLGLGWVAGLGFPEAFVASAEKGEPCPAAVLRRYVAALGADPDEFDLYVMNRPAGPRRSGPDPRAGEGGKP
jgi:transcriptional regulator with XRE-family HTH domain